MSNRRLSGIMPESGLCPLFIPWFHLCVGEGKQHRAEAQIPLCLTRGCPQALWLHFKCRELCVWIYIYIGADILFMQTTSSRCAHYSPHHKLDVFPSPSKLCTSGLLICELHTAVLISRLTPRTVCTRMHAIHWMRIASKVQYNKKEINLSNITSCRDLVPLSISGTLLFTFIFFFF